MGMNKVELHNALQLRRTMGIFDHFPSYTSTQLWTSGGSGGTVANSDGDGGLLTLTTGAVADQDAIVSTTRKLFTFVAGKPMLYQTGFKYTEANTDDAGIVFGFASSFTDILVDATYALATPLSAACIYKKPGETYWSCFSSVGATQYTTQSTVPCQSAGVIQEFCINVAIQGSNIEVTFWGGAFGPTAVTGGPAGFIAMVPNVTSMARQQPIKHVIPYSGAAAMQCGQSIKASSANSEVAYVDYIGAEFLSMI